ncbi:PHD-finger domain-containing protein [Ditylenchus destructor]|nr:PHD-finger domain-containing protein [Ditylenchus destructor]
MNDPFAFMQGDILQHATSSSNSTITGSNVTAKGRRVDSFAALLANRNKSQSSPSSILNDSTRAHSVDQDSYPSSNLVSRDSSLSDYNNGTFGGVSREEMHVSSSCAICGRSIRTNRDCRSCSVCKKLSHTECDGEGESSFGSYICPICRKSPLVGGDAILPCVANEATANRFLSGSGALESDEDEGADDMDFGGSLRSIHHRTTRQRGGFSPSPANIFGIGSSFSGNSSPLAGSSAIAHYNGSTGPLGSSIDDELFASGAPQSAAGDLRDLSGISSPAATGTSASTSSTPMLQDGANMSDSDEYRPFSSRRGDSHSNRGGRNHGKKKPGLSRQASSMRTRSGGKPPATSYAHITYEEKSERGKRGRGGANSKGKGGGRGRRAGGRGNKFSSMSLLYNASLASTANATKTKENDERESTLESGSSGKQRQVDGENDYIRTAIVTSANDRFMNSISLCLICGSVGKDVEATMINCTSCSQSYHTYCVGMHDKLNGTLFKRGWRCLDCTVCEGCGTGKDESKLLLCDECDVSYHIYCLDPPLDKIPNGSWRCKWCAMCCRCSKQAQSGLDLQRFEGFCETCYSQRKCIKCQRLYDVGDLLVKCQRCVRWVHAKCEDLQTEEEVENAAENAFRCSQCRPQLNAYNDFMNMSIIVDNVMVNKNASDCLHHLRRANPITFDPPGLPIRSHSYDQSEDNDVPDEMEKYDSSQYMPISGRGRGAGRGGGPGRRMLKMGVGGFTVRHPRHKTLTTNPDGEDTPVAENGGDTDPNNFTLNGKPRIRRPRKPRRPHLEDAYPAPIQESFFGFEAVDSRGLAEQEVREPILGEYNRFGLDSYKAGCELSEQSADALRTQQEQDMLGDILADENIDIDISDFDFNALMDDDDENDDLLDESFNDGFSATGSSGLIGSSDLYSPSTSMGPGLNETHFASESNIDHPPHTAALHLQQDDWRKRQFLQLKHSMSAGGVGAVPRSSSQHSESSTFQEKVNLATERWEEDEPLGDKSTKAAVLYANVEHPSLKHKYPLWSDRVKAINKVWRMLDSDRRQEYVEMARKNRANSTNRRRTRRNNSTMNLQQVNPSGSTEDVVVNAHVNAIKQAQAAALQQQRSLSLTGRSGSDLDEKFKIPITPAECASEFGFPHTEIGNVSHPSPTIHPGMHSPAKQKLQTGIQPPSRVIGTNPQMVTQMGGSTGNYTSQSELVNPQQQMSSPVFSDPAFVEKYSLTQKRLSTLAREEKEHDAELTRMRKEKRDMVARHRQLIKNQPKSESQDPNDPQLGTIPINQDAMNLHKAADDLKKAIQARQKRLERCKQELREHQGNLHEFEARISGVNRPTLIMPNTDQQHSAMQISASAPIMPQQSPSCATSNMYIRSALPQGSNLLSPPSGTTAFPFQARTNPQTIPMQIASRLDFGDQSSQGSDPPTPNSGRPGSSASSEIVKSGRGRKRKKLPLLDFSRFQEMRSAVLGNVSYTSLQTSHERDVYEVVDRLVQLVSLENASGNNVLAVHRILQSQSQLLGENSSTPDGCDSPKIKKKRQVLKKAQPNNDANDCELALERIQTQLAKVDFPQRSLEQFYTFDKQVLQHPTMAALPDRPGNPFIQGDELGEFSLSFMQDYYESIENGKVETDEASFYPISMSEICATVDYNALLVEGDAEEMKPFECNGTQINAKEQINNEANYNERSNLWYMSLDCLGDRSQVHSSCLLFGPCPAESEPPMEPHRSQFQQEQHDRKEEYPIELELDPKTNREEFIKKLQQILNNEGVSIEMDTPPMSPDRAELQNGFAENHKRCRHCGQHITQSNQPRPIEERLSRLGLTPPDTSPDEAAPNSDVVTFCSVPCYYKFCVRSHVPLSVDLLNRAEKYVDSDTMEKLRQISTDNFVKQIHRGVFNPENRSDAKLSFLSQSNVPASPIGSSLKEEYDEESLLEAMRQPREQLLRASDLAVLLQLKENENAAAKGEYKWKGHSWMVVDTKLLQSFQRQNYDKCASLQLQIRDHNKLADRTDDTRQCALCGERGDGDHQLTGRLLNIDANEWVHVNCALWSSEVHETEEGALVNVDAAIKRAKAVKCVFCGNTGATLKCYKLDCPNNGANFHLSCAKRTQGNFVRDKTFYCSMHDVRQDIQIYQLDALRRIYVQREENQLLAKIFNHSYSTDMMMRVGSLIFQKIGQLLPEQLKTFHNENYIFPIGYRVTRIFWSPNSAHERARYECIVEDKSNSPEFCVMYESHEFRDKTPNGAWNRLLTSIMQCREKAGNMLRFFPNQTNGETLFGFNEPAISKMIESLPGVDQLYTYTFKHGGSPLMDVPLAINPSGCARCEPCFRTLIKHRYKPLATVSPKKQQIKENNSNHFGEVMPREARSTRSSSTRYSSITSKIDQETLRAYRASGISEEVLMNSYAPYLRCEPGQPNQVYSQYRRMMKEWPNNVYLARSKIQGLGLYAKRDIDMNSMIIEYKGEVIRSEVGEVREKRYMAQNRGVYMFRIDDEFIIDATLAGGLARYINHSCDPNCSTKILPYNDDKKIIIIANRPIKAGEELTYDYQFEMEDTTDKLPCLCGAPNCNKWMN